MESSLSLKYADLRFEVGDFAGWGRDPDRWNTAQVSAIESAVRSGYRSFLNPILPGRNDTYEWSFMKPRSSLTLLSGESSVRLPDDFGHPDGNLYVVSTATTNRVPWEIMLTHIGMLDASRAMWPDRTGRPLMASIIPLKGTSAQSGQHWSLEVYPIADQDYPFVLTYSVNVDALSNSFPYHMGGMPHSETILAACCAAFERDKDNLDDGPQQRRYANRLAASIAHDRRLKPQLLGYNRDCSDNMGWGRGPWDGMNPHYLNYGNVTVNGVQY